MAAHAGVARLMYVMGRDGVFPKSFFGYVHPKWRTPAMNIILVGAIALLAINFDLVMATALINFGALVAFTFVNNRSAKRVEKLLRKPDRLISLVLIGNNLVNILASALGTIVGMRLYGDAGVAIATGVLTFVVLVFAEVLPKAWRYRYVPLAPACNYHRYE